LKTINEQEYIFTSKRLGFRNWKTSDLPMFTEMNAHTEVMRHFPKPLTREESLGFFSRLNSHFDDRGYTYFAVELLDSNEWIGFIGLAFQNYVTAFAPGVDIGWRLHPNFWGNGYATEGAKRCLKYAFDTLRLDKVFATCTMMNQQSENVMLKIGMSFKGEFHHPNLSEYPEIQCCKWYEILAADFSKPKS